MHKREGCLICGEELNYEKSKIKKICSFCGKGQHTAVYCLNGHFICDSCHGKGAMEQIKELCLTSNSKDPIALANAVMALPAFNMHGPEHHALVPAVLVTAYSNVTGDTGEEHIKEAIARGSDIPGGTCGNYGACGAGVGTGVAMSIIAGATPLTTRSWGKANLMTAHALKSIGEKGGPRCCKRCTWTAIEAAMDFLEKERGIKFEKTPITGECKHYQRNRQCQRLHCLYFPTALANI